MIVNCAYKEFQTFKALIKLSRKTAIFEFSSLNGYTSFAVDYECRSIVINQINRTSFSKIMGIGDENGSHFSYLVSYLAF